MIKRLQSTFPGLMPLVLSPLTWLSIGINNIEMLSFTAPNTKPQLAFGKDYTFDFGGFREGCFFSHFEEFCGEDAVRKVDQWLSTWKHELGIEPKAVLQGHTHRLGAEFTPSGKILISTGCMAKPQEYQILQHSKFRPPVQGFVKLFREEGGFNFNKTQIIHTGGQ